MTDNDLKPGLPDAAAAGTRTLTRSLGAVLGDLALCATLGEVLSYYIPRQREDRIAQMVRELRDHVKALGRDQGLLVDRLRDEHGIDLFEEGAIQTARSVSDERRKRIARLLARALTEEELHHARARKLLGILRSLEDPDLLMLIYFSKPLAIGSSYHRKLMRLHREILEPVSQEMGRSQAEIDRGAMFDAYQSTLITQRLIEDPGKGPLRITNLGRLLLRYVEHDEGEDEKAKAG